MKKKIAIIGLGYVGLPLAVEFGNKHITVGFDIDRSRVNELKTGNDSTCEISSQTIKNAAYLSFTDNLDDIKSSNIFIVTVPTPVDENKRPDLTPLKDASTLIGSILKKGDVVIYESTVYPGATEEFCVPILESESNLTFNQDFFCGYSPERINPGDKEVKLTDIVKVTSGSNPKTAKEVNDLYKEIIKAGTYCAESIKIAEAAKVIENTQRDLNIALMNEFSLIFNRLKIDTQSVINAAKTKWNFLEFKPGLVGGHCIGVDPYYLVHKSIELGFTPELILAGRRLNDSMGEQIFNQILKLAERETIPISGANILIMGITFKENCQDLRNTRIIEIVKKFIEFNCNVHIYDPIADPNKVKNDYDIDLIKTPYKNYYDVIVLAVAHDIFKKNSTADIKDFGKESHILYDVKWIFDKEFSDGRL